MMRFATAASLLLALATPLSEASAQSKELLLYSWSNYMAPEMLKRFTAETGIKVTLDTYDTNQTLLAKIQAGGGGYDVVVPSGPTVQTMVRNGLLQRIDVSALPNFGNVKAPFDKPSFDPGRAYSAPFMWGVTAFAYDTAKVTGKLENSWKELFEPRPELAGKIAMLKDVSETVGAAAHYLGFDYCTENPAEAQKILELLEKQKPAVKVYSAEGSVDRAASGEVAMHHMWNGSFHRAHKRRATLAYVFPKEGLNLWGDNLAVPVGARSPDSAKTFINWMMDPKNAAEASNFTGYNNAINGSDAFLNADLREDPAVNTPPEATALFRPTRECPKAALDLRERIWTRLLR